MNNDLITNEFTQLIRKYIEIDDQLREGSNCFFKY